MYRLATVLNVFLFVGCSYQLPGKLNTHRNDGPVDSGDSPVEPENLPARPDQDPKPSEDGEGLPGYLTNPALVGVQVSDFQVGITAPAGTVGEPENTEVRLIKVNAVSLYAALAGEDSVSLSGTRLVAASVNPDGSFSVQAEVSDMGPLILALGTLNQSSNGDVSARVSDPVIRVAVIPLTLEPVQSLASAKLNCGAPTSSLCKYTLTIHAETEAGDPILEPTVELFHEPSLCGFRDVVAADPCATGDSTLFQGLTVRCFDGEQVELSATGCLTHVALQEELKGPIRSACTNRCEGAINPTGTSAQGDRLFQLQSGQYSGTVSALEFATTAIAVTIDRSDAEVIATLPAQ